MSDTLFNDAEGELRSWALRLNELVKVAKTCPEVDRGPVIAMADYLLESCKRLITALEGEPSKPLISEADREYLQEYHRRQAEAAEKRQQEQGKAREAAEAERRAKEAEERERVYAAIRGRTLPGRTGEREQP